MATCCQKSRTGPGKGRQVRPSDESVEAFSAARMAELVHVKLSTAMNFHGDHSPQRLVHMNLHLNDAHQRVAPVKFMAISDLPKSVMARSYRSCSCKSRISKKHFGTQACKGVFRQGNPLSKQTLPICLEYVLSGDFKGNLSLLDIFCQGARANGGR